MPEASLDEGDWWLDAVKRPLGAYFRVDTDMIPDIHSALAEAGVLYASALTHAGWDALHHEAPSRPPSSPDEFPVIETREGLPDAGHAFAIVGYTERGFVIHNSWGDTWGAGGFAILPYADWRQNAMDCWVAQLGVVTDGLDLLHPVDCLDRNHGWLVEDYAATPDIDQRIGRPEVDRHVVRHPFEPARPEHALPVSRPCCGN